MDTQTKELIAIGAAVTANCVPCLKFHLAKAREAGTEEGQIHAAVRVGRMIRKGAAGVWDGEAKALLGDVGADPCPLSDHTREEVVVAAGATGGCGSP